ncbi:MAG: hypothetical protein ACEQR8_03230 [Cypionkella sp.]
MDQFEDARDWRERLRDELLPYLAYYSLGLLWLSTAGLIGAWSQATGFALLALTAVFGIPMTALVSLMMLWRMFMIGIDTGRVVGMVASVASSIALLIFASGAALPAVAIGHSVGELQMRAVGLPPREEFRFS